MNSVKVKVKVSKDYPLEEWGLPQFHTSGAACFDVRAILKMREFICEGSTCIFNTGLFFEIPDGYVMLVYSRSGQGFKHNIRLSNSVGVIDSDYRGELLVKLTNDSKYNGYSVEHGERIAQCMIIPIPQVELVLAEELSVTERGENGGGSTGVV